MKSFCLMLCGVVLLAGAVHADKLPAALGSANHGLCIVIGAGDAREPKLAADLAARGLLVHGIALDDAALDRARKAVAATHTDGTASIERIPVAPLPYRDNLANFLIVADHAAATAAGLAATEMLRVVAPLGQLIVRKNKRWETIAKPMPTEMDEWTHDTHGPDGTLVSNDKVVRFPVGYRWHAGLPMNLQNKKQPANVWSDTRGLALAGGRCFTLSCSVIENLGATFSSEHGIDQYVTCRDAFNGLLLWRAKVGPTYYAGLYYPNRAPFVAVGDYVYVAAGDGKLWALDAQTGKLARKFDTTFPPCRLLVDDGVVAVACWKEGTRLGGVVGVDRRLMDWAVSEGSVEAFDATSGRPLWKMGKLATSLRSAGGTLFMVQRAGADSREEMGYGKKTTGALPSRPEQHPVAVDLRTGKQLWETKLAKPELNETLSVDAAGFGAVAISHNNGKRTSILSAGDGRVLVEVSGNGYAAFVDGAIHLGGKKYDPSNGQSLGASTFKINSTICTPQYFVNNILIQNRGGTIVVDGTPHLYGGTRGACFFASTPAYGAFYTPQNWCMCAPAQIPGFICFGPIAHEPTADEMQQPSPVERGPAYNTSHVSRFTNHDSDWPTYRHDPQRSNATDINVPDTLDILWQRSVVPPAPDSPLGCDWRETLTGPLTAPVVAEGVVIAAATDRDQLIALDAANGKELWRATVGGRLDSPPTIHAGLCLIGSHDGYVYAFTLDKGQLAWRVRVAPREERIVSSGKVESPWPVIGTVLVADGTAFVSAGNTQGSDGGIVVRAFAPLTGKILWSKAVVMTTNAGQYRDMRRNDLLLKVGNSLQWMTTRLDPKTGEFQTSPTVEYQQFQAHQHRIAMAVKKNPARKVKELEETATPDEIAPGIGLEGFIAATWMQLGDRKYKAMTFGNTSAPQLSWGGDLVCGNPSSGKTVCAINRDKVAPFGNKPDPKAVRWQQNLPENYQATSVVTAPNAIVVGGGVYRPGETGGGFMRVLSTDKGATLAEQLVGSPLIYNSVAVAGGKVYATLADGSVLCLGKR